jgi:hypothetical protein
MWRGHGNYMLLPALRETEVDFAADFREITSVTTKELTTDRRIATLSADGLLLLQQRSVYFWTRLKVPLGDLAQQFAPILTEMEIQRDWAEEALSVHTSRNPADVVAEAERELAEWLNENDFERRKKLQQVQNHAALRRESRREMAIRFAHE